MPSVLNVDTLVAANGTDPVTLTKQSAAKAWVKFTNVTTSSINASFNISSLDDDGTGDFGINFTNSMSGAEYSAPASSGEDNRIIFTNFGTVTSGAMDGQTRQVTANALIDAPRNSIEILGDLA
jgi:hypothetical protein